MNAQQHRHLNEQGYLLFKSLLPLPQITALLYRLEELWIAEGDEAGAENYLEPGVRRLANLANKGEIFRGLYIHPQVLDVAEAVMGPEIRVSMVNARDVPPHASVRMPFHMDSEGGLNRDEKGYHAASAIWMLDAFTVENGATAFVPGSHLTGQSPKQVLTDLNAPHPDEMILTGEPGDVLVFNGHLWHAGRPNLTGEHRRAIFVHYVRADIPHRVNRRQHLSPENIARLSPRERTLLGLDD